MNKNQNKGRCLYIVWKGYQRRAEVLAPLFDADIKFIPHLFRNKYLRPLDYFYKLVVTVFYMLKTKPSYAIVQAPPHYAALPPLILGTPYIIDGHNGIFQSYWHKLPLFSTIMEKSKAIIVHNSEFLAMFGKTFPKKPFIVVADPLQYIDPKEVQRKKNQILFVCSFDHDEPIEAIINTIERTPDYNFVITADPKKLPLSQRQRLEACDNLHLTGFLSTEAYHETLCSSTAAIALTNMVATQQSGACEALSSNTPLIATRSTLSEKLFGDWAILVDNNADSIVNGIRNLKQQALDLHSERNDWNNGVKSGVSKVKLEVLGEEEAIPEEIH